MATTTEILEAVDGFIRVHDEWENSLQGPPVPTRDYEDAIEEAIHVCQVKDAPAKCQELVDVVSRLGVEWEAYKSGEKRREDYTPLGVFWATIAAVLIAREGSTTSIARPQESVAKLLADGVSHRQIALYLYGEDGKGPFIDAQGRVDSDAIEKEAREPGTVVEKGWVHPSEMARVEEERRRNQNRLDRLNIRENEENSWDPASIEDLLREGQFIGTVAKVKGVDIAEVVEVANKLAEEGIEVQELPNTAAMRAPQEPQITPEQDRTLQPKADSDEVDGNEPEESADDAGNNQSNADIDALIIEMLSDRPDLSAGDIVEKLRAEWGTSVTIQKVTGVMRSRKKKTA